MRAAAIGAGFSVLALFAVPAPAEAFRLFGFTIFGGGEDTSIEILDPLSYDATSDIRTEDSKLERALLAASDLWRRREDPASGSAGLIVSAKGDYRRLLAALYTEGYYSGAISILINGREAGGLANTTQLAEPVNIRIAIDPGPSYLFGETGFTAAPQGFGTGDNQPPGTVRRVFTAGKPARADVIDDVGREAVEVWRSQGYPKAAVAGRAVIADHNSRRLDANITLQPGRQARLSAPETSGSQSVDPAFIRYMTGLEGGEKFDPETLNRARERLTRLGTFSSVRMVEGEEISPDGTLSITAEVQDRKPRRIGVGATLATIDGLGLEAFWLHRNTGGKAERLRLEASIGGLGTVSNPGDLDYQAGISFSIPGVFNPDTTYEIGASAEQNVFDLYRERAVSVRNGVRRIFTERLDGSLFLETSYSRVDDPAGTREFLTVSLPGELRFDKRDDEVDPTRGYYLEGRATPFSELQFGTNALNTSIEARGYISFGQTDATVLAGKIGLGSVIGGTLRDLPPDQLFFAGGGGSVRGYGFRSIGTEVGGEILGGRSLFEASAEYRQRITDRMGVAAFVDAGRVGTGSFAGEGGSTQFGAGLGLRYLTSLGPLRFDVATPLNPRPDDPTVAFYIGLGQAF